MLVLFLFTYETELLYEITQKNAEVKRKDYYVLARQHGPHTIPEKKVRFCLKDRQNLTYFGFKLAPPLFPHRRLPTTTTTTL